MVFMDERFRELINIKSPIKKDYNLIPPLPQNMFKQCARPHTYHHPIAHV